MRFRPRISLDSETVEIGWSSQSGGVKLFDLTYGSHLERFVERFAFEFCSDGKLPLVGGRHFGFYADLAALSRSAKS